MILKVVTVRDATGVPERTMYLDRLARVVNNGAVRTTVDGLTGCALFTNRDDLRPIIANRWGGDVVDSFGEGNVHWPELGAQEHTITEIFAERDDRSCVLVLACDDVFLMSDDGKTIDRLN